MKHTILNVCRKITGIVFTLVFVCLIGVFTAFAADDGEREHQDPQRNWELTLGAGVGAYSKYLGFDEMEIASVPVVMARYRTNYLDFFINPEEGAGVTFKLPQHTLVTLSAGVNLGIGNGRKNSYADRLKRTADIDVPYLAFGKVDIPLLFGTLSGKLSYLPMSADYDEAELQDKEYNGILAEVEYGAEMWLRRNLMLNFGLGLNWMNDEYAKAIYRVEYDTEALDVFSASSGLQDVHASLGAILMLSRYWGTGLVADISYLVGDAADSPLTVETFQPGGGMFVFYNF